MRSGPNLKQICISPPSTRSPADRGSVLWQVRAPIAVPCSGTPVPATAVGQPRHRPLAPVCGPGASAVDRGEDGGPSDVSCRRPVSVVTRLSQSQSVEVTRWQPAVLPGCPRVRAVQWTGADRVTLVSYCQSCAYNTGSRSQPPTRTR